MKSSKLTLSKSTVKNLKTRTHLRAGESCGNTCGGSTDGTLCKTGDVCNGCSIRHALM